jgi:hypothetical protein
MMTTGETHGSVSGYFRAREEVSALYVSLPSSPSDDRGVMKVAVLLRDAGLAEGELELLVRDYRQAVSDIVDGKVIVMVLNAMDPGLRQVVLKKWQLLVDRNRRYLAWFMRATREEAGAGHGPANGEFPPAETEEMNEVSEALREWR